MVAKRYPEPTPGQLEMLKAGFYINHKGGLYLVMGGYGIDKTRDDRKMAVYVAVDAAGLPVLNPVYLRQVCQFLFDRKHLDGTDCEDGNPLTELEGEPQCSIGLPVVRLFEYLGSNYEPGMRKYRHL